MKSSFAALNLQMLKSAKPDVHKPPVWRARCNSTKAVLRCLDAMKSPSHGGGRGQSVCAIRETEETLFPHSGRMLIRRPDSPLSINDCLFQLLGRERGSGGEVSPLL
jgi:hypothetical protein